ncbi:aldehyde dehydrogenase family protein [Amycolatopsis mediterranei]|uniref:aldehyde dehydrogenase family protein n=1 Tax=Amycolatopsis mediterranei TaxID=33910 RepID=UPI0034222CAC
MTRTLDLTDPATGEVFGTSPIAEQSDVDAALESAAQAFAIWRRSTPAQRQLALLARVAAEFLPPGSFRTKPQGSRWPTASPTDWHRRSGPRTSPSPHG